MLNVMNESNPKLINKLIITVIGEIFTVREL